MTFLPRLSRTTVLAVSLVAALALGATSSNAGPISPQVSGGWYTESDAMFLGAGASISLTTITVTPNFEYIFVENGTAFTVNLDATMSVLPLGVANGYVGAGIGSLTVDPDVGGSSTSDMVVNLIAGAGFSAAPLKPFGQFKWVVVDGDDPMVFSFGIRF